MRQRHLFTAILGLALVLTGGCSLEEVRVQATNLTPGDSAPGDGVGGDAIAGDTVGGDPVALLDLGGACTLGTQCVSTFCANGVCCDAACDRACEDCSSVGACDVQPVDDTACGDIDCDLLDTDCLEYDDLTADRCAGLAACKAANTSDCDQSTPMGAGLTCDDSDPLTRDDGCDGAGSCAGTPRMLAKVGHFAMTTDPASTPLIITGVGFAPKVVMFWWSGRNDLTAVNGGGTYRRGFSFTDGSGNCHMVATRVQDNVDPSNTRRWTDDATCVGIMWTGGGTDGEADLASLDSDGFTLTIVDNFSTDFTISYLALGGPAITDTAMGVFQSPLVIGTQAIDTVGFTPDFLLFLGSYETTALPDQSGDAVMSMGVSTGILPEQNAIMANCMNTGDIAPVAPDPPDTSWMTGRGYARLGESIGTTGSCGSMTERGNISALTANGFEIDWTEIHSSRANYYMYLAMRGGAYRIDSLLTGNDIVTPIVETGFGFEPSAALFGSTGRPENSEDSTHSYNQHSVGAFSSITDLGVHAAYSSNGWHSTNYTSQSSYAFSPASLYLDLSGGGSIRVQMDLTSVDSDGFTAIMADDDTTSYFVWYTAFGPR